MGSGRAPRGDGGRRTGLPGRLRRGVVTEAAGSRRRGEERSAPRSPADSFPFAALVARLGDEVYDEDANTLQDFAYDREPLGIANPSSMIGEMYTLYYPPEKR